MDAAESVLRAGYKLDRYELLCPIATGGMATVWLARLRGKRGFEKLFAIKTIRTELVEDQRFQEMFLDEARIASGIQHPNVAQILDLGEQDDVLFIVMEWVDGDALAKIRKLLGKRGAKVPIGVGLRVLADACAGLHAAHELRDDKGEPLEIVHRDVSPQNILVASTGAVKVIDFGIAKAHNRKQGETRTGVVKGKIHYMAPEQVKKGRTVDRRTDVWALGVCLHELVAGRLPYDGDDDVEVIRKLMTDEAPPPASGIPDPVARVLERSMALDADARFPTAAGMQRALEATLKELGESTTSEDVASFLRAELPELSRTRREVVGKATDEARERGTPITEARESGTSRVATRRREEDVAFAPTVMSEREPAIALRKRKDGAATSASVALDQEPLRIPKKSRAWLWVLLLLVGAGGGAAYRWPAQARRVLGALGLPGGTAPVPTGPATEIRSVAQPAPPPPSPIPAPSASPVVPTSAAAPSGERARGSSEPNAKPHPSEHEPIAEPPPARSAATAAASATAVPVASASASAISPLAPLPPSSAAPAGSGATPSPSASADDDPNNPYNN